MYIGGSEPFFGRFHLTSEGGYAVTASSYIIPPYYYTTSYIIPPPILYLYPRLLKGITIQWRAYTRKDSQL